MLLAHFFDFEVAWQCYPLHGAVPILYRRITLLEFTVIFVRVVALLIEHQQKFHTSYFFRPFLQGLGVTQTIGRVQG